MPSGLRRYHHSGQSHFLTFSCYHRQLRFQSAVAYGLFLTCLENMRVKFGVYVYGYVVMPEHVHLLVSEPKRQTLADAMHYLKLSFTKRLRRESATAKGPFWQARGYDRNVRNAEEFAVKLRYMHENPVKRGLVTAAEDWKWSSFRHYFGFFEVIHLEPLTFEGALRWAFREVGVVEIESEWTARDREARRVREERTFLLPPDLKPRS